MFFFFSSRRRHTRFDCDWSSDVCSSDLAFRDIAWREIPQEGRWQRVRAVGLGALLALPLLLVFGGLFMGDRKSTRLNSSHSQISYAVFCLKKKEADASSVTVCTVHVSKL